MTAKIIAKLSAAMNDIGAVGKDGKYQDGRMSYKYRGVDGVVNAVSPAFRRHGIVCVPTLLEKSRDTTATRSGGRAEVIHIRVRYTFYDAESGESIATEVPGQAFDTSDKATAKAMSVALRIALLQVLMLPTCDTDPDAERIEMSEQGRMDERAFIAGELEEATTREQLGELWTRAQNVGVMDTSLRAAFKRKGDEVNG